MNDEFNPKGTDNDKPILNGIEMKEDQNVFSNEAPSEYPDYGTQKVQKRKTVSRSAQTLSLSLTAVAAVSAVVAVGSTVITLDPTEVVFNYIKASDSAIYYDIELKNRSDSELSLVISDKKNFINRTKIIEGTEISGKEVDLKTNMTYTVAVKTGSKTLASQEVRVLKTDELVLTVLYSVELRCTCAVDEMFHFTLNYVDQNNYWSNFSATLTDYKGTDVYYEFNADPHSEQSINIVANNLFGTPEDLATLVVRCYSMEPDENGKEPAEPVEKIIYTNNQVEI